jgi:hypothetical protein
MIAALTDVSPLPPAEFAEDPRLRAHGFVFHIKYRLFICVDCGTGVHNLRRHCQKDGHPPMSNQTFQDLKDTFDPHPDPYSLLPGWSPTSALP